MDQTAAFAATESARYVRDRQGFALPTVRPEDFRGIQGSVETVLDAGCGHAVNLEWMVHHFDARRGVGLEPAPEAVTVLEDAYRDDPRLSFEQGSVHALPFPSRAFDLVVCWSVLHWVGRDEYLQAIGELVRVTGRWLVIMDFAASEPYRTPYRHVPGLWTYKQDFARTVLDSGAMQLVSSERWWEPVPGEDRVMISDDDLAPFLGNPLSYHARRVCVFERSDDVLQARSPEDFLDG